MKNEKLKSLISRKLEIAQQSANEVTILNNDEMSFTMGGNAADCPMLTSCGKYGNCGLKVGQIEVTIN